MQKHYNARWGALLGILPSLLTALCLGLAFASESGFTHQK
jgi:hypothetical protein